MKIVIWGVGERAKEFILRKGLYKHDEIIAFTDNNSVLWGKYYHNIPIIPPSELLVIDYDRVLICAADSESIRKQAVKQLGINEKTIKSKAEIDQYYIKKMVDKYKKSNDKEINDILSNFQRNGIFTYGLYRPINMEYELYRDENNQPYILYEGKRVYYKAQYEYIIRKENKEYVNDLMYEQKEHSPHLYVKNPQYITDGAVVVDAGTCEGNFAIQYIEKVSKMYIIESDSNWVECLQRTFYPYRDKVVICNKALSRFDSSETITLDTLLAGEKIDFLKMDIEGAEIDALLGGKKTLSKSNAHCAICSYHKMNDEDNIKFILENMGYKTSVSEGYMFFGLDENIYDTLDLRKGIVYAEK